MPHRVDRAYSTAPEFVDTATALPCSFGLSNVNITDTNDRGRDIVIRHKY